MQKQISEQHIVSKLTTDKIKLVHNGISLESDNRIQDYELKDNDIIQLIPLFDKVNILTKQEYSYSDYIEHISIENGKKYDIHHTPVITLKPNMHDYMIYGDDLIECIRTNGHKEPNKYIYLLQLYGQATASKMNIVANTIMKSSISYIECIQPEEMMKNYLKYGVFVECHLHVESVEIEPDLPVDVHVDLDEIDEDHIVKREPVTYPDRIFSTSVKVLPLLPLKHSTKYCVVICRGCPLSPIEMMEASFLSFSDAKYISYDHLVVFETL